MASDGDEYKEGNFSIEFLITIQKIYLQSEGTATSTNVQGNMLQNIYLVPLPSV